MLCGIIVIFLYVSFTISFKCFDVAFLCLCLCVFVKEREFEGRKESLREEYVRKSGNSNNCGSSHCSVLTPLKLITQRRSDNTALDRYDTPYQRTRSRVVTECETIDVFILYIIIVETLSETRPHTPKFRNTIHSQ